MNAIDRSAIEALRRMEQVRQAREDRMRNALEILAHAGSGTTEGQTQLVRFVRATAREGLGRETECET